MVGSQAEEPPGSTPGSFRDLVVNKTPALKESRGSKPKRFEDGASAGANFSEQAFQKMSGKTLQASCALPCEHGSTHR